MNNKSKERLLDLRGVLLMLVETCNDEDESEFLHDLIEKVNDKIKGDKK